MVHKVENIKSFGYVLLRHPPQKLLRHPPGGDFLITLGGDVLITLEGGGKTGGVST